jgi:hypothetical protein
MSVVIVLAGCQPGLDHDVPYNAGGGGGRGAGGAKLDAAVDSAGDGGTAARVCLAGDARQLASCASSGAGGLTVTLGARTATTAADGSFVIVPPTGVASWQVSGAAIVTSQMPFVASTSIPALSTTTFADLAAGNGVLLAPGEGSIFVRVTHGGAPLAGATVTATPPARFAAFYDGTSATQWNQNSTGAFGVAWLTGVAMGTVSITVTPTGGGAQSMPGVAVGDGTNTFIPVELP